MTPSQKILKKLGLKEPDTIESNAENKTDVKRKFAAFLFKEISFGWRCT